MQKIEFRGELYSGAERERFRNRELRMGASGIHLMGLGKKRMERMGKRQFSGVSGYGYSRFDE